MAILGFLRNKAIQAQKGAERTSVLVREVFSGSRRILHEERSLEKAEKSISDSIKKHSEKLLEHGDEAFEKEFRAMANELKRIILAELVLYHRIMEDALKIYKKNSEVAGQVPKVREEMKKIESDIRDMAVLANNIGDQFKNLGRSA